MGLGSACRGELGRVVGRADDAGLSSYAGCRFPAGSEGSRRGGLATYGDSTRVVHSVLREMAVQLCPRRSIHARLRRNPQHWHLAELSALSRVSETLGRCWRIRRSLNIPTKSVWNLAG